MKKSNLTFVQKLTSEQVCFDVYGTEGVATRRKEHSPLLCLHPVGGPQISKLSLKGARVPTFGRPANCFKATGTWTKPTDHHRRYGTVPLNRSRLSIRKRQRTAVVHQYGGASVPLFAAGLEQEHTARPSVHTFE